jgi:hypothetical protein
MKREIVITDLTRMQQGRVCIAGYDKRRTAIRPVLPYPGISERSLYNDHSPVIFPFALVEFDFTEENPKPPHTEDQFFDPYSVRYIRSVHDRKTVLEWSLYLSVADIFEQPIQKDPGYWVLDCQGPRSLGTVQPSRISQLVYESDDDEAWDYRLHFYDGTGEFYRLKITDLTWQYYFRNLLSRTKDREQVASRLTQVLQSCTVYLRIGLARGWKKFPERCYLQLNGIYTFPDHLEGKIFADFSK